MLCSDRDNQTNGFELGDPCCEWSGGSPRYSDSISHPGSADSTTSRDCTTVQCANGINPCVPDSYGSNSKMARASLPTLAVALLGAYGWRASVIA